MHTAAKNPCPEADVGEEGEDPGLTTPQSGGAWGIGRSSNPEWSDRYQQHVCAKWLVAVPFVPGRAQSHGSLIGCQLLADVVLAGKSCFWLRCACSGRFVLRCAV